ncbi:hypothetical protein JCM24511_05152 [Saitozyma sp. JCM 24511]|nr:hypothetical protein JCM24511_05152 [Saitozyma sp. JCM 24511]
MAQDIPKTMRAARVNQPGQSEYMLETLPVPSPRATQVLLRTGAAGLCHTDMMVMDGTFSGSKYPVTGSHEPCGTVVRVGEDARGVKVGDRVAALLPVEICHKCPDCTTLDWKYCANSKYSGINTDGAFAEYCIVESETCVPIPDDLAFEQAAPLTCAGVTIYSAILKADIKPGQVLAISGLGALGHLGIQIAKAMGITVVGIDARPEPIEMTRNLKLTADLLVDASKISAEEAVEQIEKLKPKDYVGWRGADAVILTADALPAQRFAMDILRRHGRFVLVAQPSKVELGYADFIFKDVTLVGSLHGNEKDLAELVRLVAKHGIRSDVVGYPMDRHGEMVKSVHEKGRKGKLVMTF